MTRLRQNILSLSVLQGANLVLPLLSVPYLVRVLGPDNFGRIAFAMAFVQFFTLLTDYGFNLSATRSVATVRDDPDRLSRLVSTVVAAKLCLMTSGFVVMVGIIAIVPVFERDWSLYGLAYLSVLGSVAFPVWLFQGLERMRDITVLAILGRVVTTLGIFLLVRQPEDYRLAAALQASGPVIAGLISMVVIRRIAVVHLRWPALPDFRLAFTGGWHVFLTTAAISLYTSSTVFMLGLLANPSAVGFFAAASKLVGVVNGLSSPITQAVFPHIVALRANSREAAIAFAGKVLRLQGSLTLASSIVLFALARPLVDLLFGSEFAPTVVLVQLMAALPFIIGLSNVLGVQVMIAFGMDQTVSRIVVFCGLANIVLIVAMVRAFGIEGAAVSALLVETAVTLSFGLALARAGLLRGIVDGVLGRGQGNSG